MKKVILGAAISLAALWSAPASAMVVVNGKVLNSAEVAWLANYTCGPVYPGNYWVNMSNGYWGYAGSAQVMGHVKDRCGPRRTFRDGNMSNEGRLYSPGELLRN